MKRRFLIYGLVDPRNGHLRYIGRSSSGLTRPRGHKCPSNLSREIGHKANWIRQLLAQGLSYDIVVIEEFDSQSELDTAEEFWIAYFASIGCDLTNKAKGGQGPKGYRQSPEHKLSISQAHRRTGHKPTTAALDASKLSRAGSGSDFKLKMVRAKGGTRIIDHYGVVYEGIQDAARKLNLLPGNIHAVLSGRYSQTGGFKFKRL